MTSLYTTDEPLATLYLRDENDDGEEYWYTLDLKVDYTLDENNEIKETEYYTTDSEGDICGYLDESEIEKEMREANRSEMEYSLYVLIHNKDPLGQWGLPLDLAQKSYRYLLRNL
jgi:hypothetical protein